MPERWRRELARLDDLEPASALTASRSRSVSEPPEDRRGGRVLTVFVAFAVFAAAGVFAWRAFYPTEPSATGGPPSTTATPSQPIDGYWIMFEDLKPTSGGNDFGVKILATTNLPEGTLLQVSNSILGSPGSEPSSGGGSCCRGVSDGQFTTTIGNSSCNGLVGATANSSGLIVTLTASPQVHVWGVPFGSDYEPPRQPQSVIDVLGKDFENLSGDQVVKNDDGTRSLVATASFEWPEPQCGGEQFPLWGGPNCTEEQGQLQGDSLKDAMGEVMGALSQARMCEFWGLELPPDVAAAHPWPEFSDEWRAWFTDPPKDFSDANSNASWDAPPFTWHETGSEGDRHFVDATDHGETILSLEVDFLPGYCPNCGSGVVPFWGVVAWTFH
jgi:hypothetical protein